ncbi:MarR family transcriptional regulator [Streptomyces sp. NPDC050287]|uniref:MarR family transcriptional regulator n=1 Tax=Streptomyces sp. NPDC050287 TaxID=3365608 RepID=UPI0037A7AC9B
MTTTAPPTVNGRVIALAHYAGRAVLETALARRGLTFQQMVTLRPVALAGAPVERDELTGQVVDALKVDAVEVRGVVEELTARGLLAAEASRLRATDAGQALYTEVNAETAPISARIYAGIPAEDLATAGRVLALVTERANAELAALSR